MPDLSDLLPVRCLKRKCQAIIAYLPPGSIDLFNARCSQCQTWRHWPTQNEKRQAGDRHRASKPPTVASPINVEMPEIITGTIRRKKREVKA